MFGLSYRNIYKLFLVPDHQYKGLQQQNLNAEKNQANLSVRNEK